VTGIPKRRYYVVLIILMVGSVFAFGAMFYYVRSKATVTTTAPALTGTSSARSCT
jgi:hypothetical protein